MLLPEIQLTLYVVRNAEGKFYRSKGYNGYGDSWVEKVEKARIYTRIGPARGQVSFWANAYPEYGIPDLLEITISNVRILDESARVKKMQDKKFREQSESDRLDLIRRIKNLSRDINRSMSEKQELVNLLDRINKAKK